MSLNPGVLYIKRAYLNQIRKHLGHVSTVQRAEKALEILTRDNTYSWIRTDFGEFLMLHIGSEVTFEYRINTNDHTCDCPDGVNGNICKHRQAMEILLEAEHFQHLDTLD